MMRVARVATPDGPRLALIEPDQEQMRLLPRSWGDDPLSALAARTQAVKEATRPQPLDRRSLLCAVASPGKIIGVGLNYADHAREVGRPLPEAPPVFFRPATTLASPYGALRAHPREASLDYEGELAILIGHSLDHGGLEAACGAIAGFCVANDFTLRCFAKPDTLAFAKGLKASLPLGPWITAASAVPDAQSLALRTWVDGELRQNSSTSEMGMGCAALVAYVAGAISMSPGDVILTGSPHGSGAGFSPPRWLRPGTRVRVEIEHLGAIETTIAEAA